MDNKPLYALAKEFISAREQLLDADFDEQTLKDTLDGIAFPVEEKAKNIGFVTKEMDSWELSIDEAIKGLTERKKAIKKKREHLLAYLKYNMEACEITKIECPYFAISIKKCPTSILIENEDLIPADFKKAPEPVLVPDKKAISEELKAGREVAGARLIQNTRLEIK